MHDLFLTDAVADRHPELGDRAEAAGVRVARVTDKAAAALSDTVTPQGVAAVCSTVTVGLDEALAGDPRLVTVLVGVADPGNAGTVIRTSDAAGADAVVLAGEAVDPHNGKCVRASMGSLFHVPVAAHRDVDEVLDALRARGLTVLATAGDGDTVLDATADDLLAGPTAWLFGSEAHGLDDADGPPRRPSRPRPDPRPGREPQPRHRRRGLPLRVGARPALTGAGGAGQSSPVRVRRGARSGRRPRRAAWRRGAATPRARRRGPATGRRRGRGRSRRRGSVSP